VDFIGYHNKIAAPFGLGLAELSQAMTGDGILVFVFLLLSLLI